jgi:hypothetical protein
MFILLVDVLILYETDGVERYGARKVRFCDGNSIFWDVDVDVPFGRVLSCLVCFQKSEKIPNRRNSSLSVGSRRRDSRETFAKTSQV